MWFENNRFWKWLIASGALLVALLVTLAFLFRQTSPVLSRRPEAPVPKEATHDAPASGAGRSDANAVGQKGTEASVEVDAAREGLPAPDQNPSLAGGWELDAPVEVVVRAGGQEHRPSSNELGYFERVYLQPREKASVSLTWPEAQPGDKVVMEVEDGGELDNGKALQQQPLDGSGSLQFAFQASQYDGIHRVVLRRGRQMKVLDFWVGPELPLASPILAPSTPAS